MFEGNPLEQMEHWFAKPWLMPAVVVSVKILWQFSSNTECIDDSFMQEFNEISAAGLGKSPENIDDVNCKLELLFSPASKAFTTVGEFFDHLRLCLLVKII